MAAATIASTMAFPRAIPIPNEDTNPLKTLLSSPHCCSSTMQAKQIHASILRTSCLQEHSSEEEELFLYSKFLVLCTTPPLASHGGLDYANLIFQQPLIQQRASGFMWNTLIRAHSLSQNPVNAILLYNQMRKDYSVEPNSYTFTFLLKACSNLPDGIRLGSVIHGQAIMFGLLTVDAFVGTSLIDMYMNAGCVEMAKNLFDRMPHRTSTTCNAMIAGFLKSGDDQSARFLFDAMPDRLEKEWNLFVGMPVKTLATWNTMVGAYVKSSRPVEAVSLCRRMQLAGINPDKITVASVLPACAQVSALELGEWLHSYADKNGFGRNITVCNALIDMYAKCGSIEKAIDVFEDMIERDLITWNTMISGLAMHGRGEEAIQLFEEMESKAVGADDITFVGLLNACGHAGLVDQAWCYFERMEDLYKINPKIEHYGCMVDALGRAQCLDKAVGLVNQMPFEANSIILGSLLGSCRISNNLKVGESMLKKLIVLEPQNSGYYVLLSNMYACTGQWEEVIRIRKLLKLMGIKKTPGCSSIEVDNLFHEFIAGDKTHPMTKDIYAKLDEVLRELRLVGYVPDISVVAFDLDEDEKAQNLSVHSEKLAVTFGLMTVRPGKVIRVVKNLRVCVDCHSALKLISKVYDREIVLRDCSRFHHFRDGQCSCNEFW